MDYYKACTLGIVDAANRLRGKLEGRPIPADYDPGDLYSLQIIANIRHDYTNYEELLEELPMCWDYIHSGGVCPHDIKEEECPLVSTAHVLLKQQAKRIAIDLYQEWKLAGRGKQP